MLHITKFIIENVFIKYTFRFIIVLYILTDVASQSGHIGDIWNQSI